VIVAERTRLVECQDHQRRNANHEDEHNSTASLAPDGNSRKFCAVLRARTTTCLAFGRWAAKVTANVGELRDLGYLSTAPHPADGRMKVLTLTAAGRAALEADRTARAHRLADALERSLSGEEVHDLARTITLIERVAAAVAAGDGHGQPPVTGDW
jgi:predicted MarR family transcription regulator